MKEILRSRIGKIAVKAMIWGVVGFAIVAAGNGLLILVMEIDNMEDIIGNAFGFIYGLFYCIGMASYCVVLAAILTLLVMIIVKYSKRRFCKKIN